MLKGKIRKLEPLSQVCFFVGYPKGTKGGLFYDPQDKKVFVSTNTTFLENNYMIDFKPRNKIVTEELLYDQIIPQPTTVVEEQSMETTIQNQEPLPPRHCGKVVRVPAHYKQEREAEVVASADSEEDLVTYRSTMGEPNSKKWQEAMNLEMKSMYSNYV